jgi:predicted choloylglycine hydrolase
MRTTFEAISEATPGGKWLDLYERLWPSYRDWFVRHGGPARAGVERSIKLLRRDMPELAPTFDTMLMLASNEDPAFLRFLTMYRPPAYLGGCSQAVWTRDGEPVLVRNYDLDPRLIEAVILHSAWRERPVIATSEFLWGAADGVNDRGLAASLAFGGRWTVGSGFGVPIIIRYLLEICDRTKDAIEVLRRVPSHMTYTVTVVDAAGDFATVWVAPDRETLVTRAPLATNHQDDIDFGGHAERSRTVEREAALRRLLCAGGADGADDLAAAFLKEPLYTTGYWRGFGTVYTAVYRPAAGSVTFRWPDHDWTQTLTAFEEGRVDVAYYPSGARVHGKARRDAAGDITTDIHATVSATDIHDVVATALSEAGLQGPLRENILRFVDAGARLARHDG